MFLSPDWLRLLEDALPAPAADVSVRVEQRVTGAPGGEVRYHVVIDDGRARVEADPGTPADLVLCLPYPVAVELATGRTTPQDALQRGALTVTGDLRRLSAVTAAMASLATAMAAVREATTYP